MAACNPGHAFAADFAGALSSSTNPSSGSRKARSRWTSALSTARRDIPRTSSMWLHRCRQGVAARQTSTGGSPNSGPYPAHGPGREQGPLGPLPVSRSRRHQRDPRVCARGALRKSKCPRNEGSRRREPVAGVDGPPRAAPQDVRSDRRGSSWLRRHGHVVAARFAAVLGDSRVSDSCGRLLDASQSADTDCRCLRSRRCVRGQPN
jgi:hypothetical protein